jgi:hypothetical protein
MWRDLPVGLQPVSRVRWLQSCAAWTGSLDFAWENSDPSLHSENFHPASVGQGFFDGAAQVVILHQAGMVQGYAAFAVDED